ncbi:MAG: acetoacetyl-CoA reductase [Planctomycetota bacterium]|jgi:acetoacetyl-CoA reductase
MTSQNNPLAISIPTTVNEIEKIQSAVLDNWFNSIDTAVGSLSHFFKLANSTMSSLNYYQNDNINAYFNGHSTPVKRNQTYDKNQTGVKQNKENLTGVALVTGGIGGIGTAICQRLSLDNAKIIGTYISAEKKYALQWQRSRQEEGLDVDLFECDVSDFESCRKMATKIENSYGRVDVLVNCAGITRDAMLKKLDNASWHAVLDTNLDSVFNITRNFIDGMIKRGHGRIINISSVNGQKGQFGQTNYSSSKAGMIGFTRSLAVELADKGITVNCVCPGYVATNMVDAIPDHIKQAIISQIPAGRLARPKEIADAVGFLASNESGYITGTELAVNGGLWTG